MTTIPDNINLEDAGGLPVASQLGIVSRLVNSMDTTPEQLVVVHHHLVSIVNKVRDHRNPDLGPLKENFRFVCYRLSTHPNYPAARQLILTQQTESEDNLDGLPSEWLDELIPIPSLFPKGNK